MITLWGPVSSGKTALLAYLHLRSHAAKSDWHVFPTDLSLPEINRQSGKILRQNEFPLATPTTEEQTLAYDFKDRRTGDLFRLETTDRAGGRSEAMDPVLIESLVNSEGIVLLLDHNRGHRETEVIEVLNHMYVKHSALEGNRGQQDSRPLAVCLSKVDQFIRNSDDLRIIREDPERFVQERLSGELLGWIQQYHGTVKYFPMSSAGVLLSHGCVQKSAFYDESLMLRVTNRGTPINIMAPFVWIFEKLRGTV